MIEINGDIWSYLGKGHIVIPTNGFVRKDGCCVMGRGLAHQCAVKFPSMPKKLGSCIVASGNHVFEFTQPEKFFSFPVKHSWWEEADVKLIERSAKELIVIMEARGSKVFLPRVGCGNGRLDWKVVKQVLEPILTDDKFVIVNKIN